MIKEGMFVRCPIDREYPYDPRIFVTGKVLSINGGSAKNSANIEQRDYKDEKSQKWIAVKQTNGRIVFLSVLDADYCVDLQAAIAANLTS